KVISWSIQCQSFSRSSGFSPSRSGRATASIAAPSPPSMEPSNARAVPVAAEHGALDALVGRDPGQRADRLAGLALRERDAVAPAGRLAAGLQPELDDLDLADPHRPAP